MTDPRPVRSLAAAIRDEVGSLLHAHTLSGMRSVLIRQGQPSPGLFLLLQGEVLLQKELELVMPAPGGTAASSGSAAVATEAGPGSARGATLHKRSVKPLQVAILSPGDIFGDLGALDGDSMQRRSPVTVLANSAQLQLLFLKRADLRALSKPLIRALRAHSAQRLEAHVARVSRLLETLGPALPGELRSKEPSDVFWGPSGANRGVDSWNAINSHITSSSHEGTVPSTPAFTPLMVPLASALVNPSVPSPRHGPMSAAPGHAESTAEAGHVAATSSTAVAHAVSSSTPAASHTVHTRAHSSTSPSRRPLVGSGSSANVAPSSSSSGSPGPSASAPTAAAPVTPLSPEILAARRLAKQKAAALFQESLAKRYTNMKLRSAKLFFPPRLLEKMRDMVAQDAAAGLRVVSKGLGALLAPPGLGADTSGASADQVDREQKDAFRFLGEALRSAESRKNMAILRPGDVAPHLAAAASMMRAEAAAAAARVEAEAALKAGAIEALMQEERARTAAMLAGGDVDTVAHWGAPVPPRPMVFTMPAHLTDSSSSPRIQPVPTARTGAPRTTRSPDAPHKRSLTAAASQSPAEAAAAAVSLAHRSSPTRSLSHVGSPLSFRVNKGLDAEFLAGEGAHGSAPSMNPGKSRAGGRAAQLAANAAASAAAGSASSSSSPMHSSLHHRASFPPPDAATKLLSIVYGAAPPDAAHRLLPGAGLADRHGKDLESLPGAPPRPADWKPHNGDDMEDPSLGGGDAALSAEDRAATLAVRDFRHEVLTSPAPPMLHSVSRSRLRGSSAGHAHHHAGDVHTFAEEFTTFSTPLRGPMATLVRKRTAEAYVPSDGSGTGSGTHHRSKSPVKKFFPATKGSSPSPALGPVREQMHAHAQSSSSTASPALLPRASDTPQAALARVQAQRLRAEALAKESLLSSQPRHELDASQQYELDRQQAMQAFCLSRDEDTPWGVEISGVGSDGPLQRQMSLDKHQPLSPPMRALSVSRSMAAPDDFLSRSYRVPSPRKRAGVVFSPSPPPPATLTRANTHSSSRPGTSPTTPLMIPSSSSSSGKSYSKRMASSMGLGMASAPVSHTAPPAHAQDFARKVKEKLEGAERVASMLPPPPTPLPAPVVVAQVNQRAAAANGAQPSPVAEGDELLHSPMSPSPDMEVAVSFTPISGTEDSMLPTRENALAVQRAEETAARPHSSPQLPLTARPSMLSPRPPTSGSGSGPSSARRRRAGSRAQPPASAAEDVLSHPSMRLIGSQGSVRPRKEGSPPRRVARFHGMDDPLVALTPLTADMSEATPRAALIAAVSVSAKELTARLDAKALEKANAPPPRHTHMIMYSPATLHVMNKAPPVTVSPLSAGGGGEEESKQPADESSDPNSAALGSHLRGKVLSEIVIGANKPRLDLTASIPPESPRKKKKTNRPAIAQPSTNSLSMVQQALDAVSLGKDASSSGTDAAAGGALASSMAPLSASLNANGLGSLLTGLTAAAQMLPASTRARKLAELYAHYQRHLARSADYFVQESERARALKAARELEAQRKHQAEQAALGLIAPLTPPRNSGKTLHRVDSEGWINGPDRVVPSLAPGADQTMQSDPVDPHTPARPSNFEPLSSLSSAHRRGGGLVGMLEGQSPQAQAESIEVLADMLARDDALDNEQALRVLNSFDRKKGVYLPPVLLKRAQDLHQLLEKRAEQKAAAAVLPVVAPSPVTAAADKASSSPDDEEKSQPDNPSPEEAPVDDVLVSLRRMAQRKAQAKFRVAPSLRLFGNKAQADATTAQAQAYKRTEHEDDEEEKVEIEKRALDYETAQRVADALEAANLHASQTTPAASSGRVLAPPPGSTAAIESAPLPPAFMALYSAYAVAPSRDGSGIATRPLASGAGVHPAPGIAPPGMRLLDVVRARANLERKLRQDDFMTRFDRGQPSSVTSPVAASNVNSATTSVATSPGAHDVARQQRLAELHQLQLEHDAEKSTAAASALSSPHSDTRSVASSIPASESTSAHASITTSPAAASRTVRFPGASVHGSVYAHECASDDDASERYEQADTPDVPLEDDGLDVDQLLSQMAQTRAAAKRAAEVSTSS